MKTYYVYLYQNIINFKIYVGMTSNLAKRRSHHKLVAKYGANKYKNSYSYFQKAISKYGIENFNFYILEKHSNKNDCSIAEKFWIEYLNSRDHNIGYNITAGGDGISEFKHSQETKNHLSKVMTGRKRNKKSIELTASKARGELSSNSKITELQAKEIKSKYGSGNYTYKILAKEYNLSPQQTHRIVNGKRWTHLK